MRGKFCNMMGEPTRRAILLRVLVGFALAIGVLSGVPATQGGEISVSKEALLDAEQLLAKQVESGALTAVEAEPLARILRLPASDRFRLFLPTAATVAALASGNREEPAIAKVRKVMKEPLERLAREAFQSCNAKLESGDHAAAFRACFETLAYQPEHREARSLLEPWLRAASQRKLQAKADRHVTDLDWKGGSYSLATTSHFAIYSRAPSKVTGQLADLCEQTLCAWQQIFFDYWCDDSGSLTPFRTANSEQESSPFRVVLCRDQDEYFRLLRTVEPNIQISTGYYSPKHKTAFFYWDGRDQERALATLRHELAHQFFQEAGKSPARLDADQQSGIWSVEGVALYFESLSQLAHGSLEAVEVGGWDAVRLQAARFRRLHDETWIPWNELHEETGSRLRARKEIAIWYTQSAGLVHRMMDGEPPMQKRFMTYLQSVYDGNPKGDFLDGSASDDLMRANYDRYLQVAPERVRGRTASPQRYDMVLSRLKVRSDDLLQWPVAGRTFKWFDLSFTQVDDRLFEGEQGKEWQAVRLSLEGTKITGRSMESILKMPKLEELDLSLCDVHDSDLEGFRGNTRIKYLWLTGTKISDQSIEVLKTMRSLELLELSNTGVTQEGIKKLKRSLPKWKSQ